LDTHRIIQGEQRIYDFPSYEEKEGLPVTISLKYQESKTLPDFIIKQNNGFTLEFNPTNLTKPGLYLLSVELSDGYSSPSLY